MKGALKDGKNKKGPGYRSPTFYRLAKINLNSRLKRGKFSKRNAF